MNQIKRKPGRPRKHPPIEKEAQRAPSRSYQNRMPPSHRWAATQLLNVRRRAKVHNQRVELTTAMIESLWQEGMTCPVTGLQMTIQGHGKGEPPPRQATLVLKDRAGDYTRDNVRLISHSASRSLARQAGSDFKTVATLNFSKPRTMTDRIRGLLVRLLRCLD